MENSRYTYYFDNPLIPEEVQNLIDVLSQHEKIDLFITTEGGETVSTEVLIHYLNGRKDDIVLYFTDFLMSAGVLILCDFKGKKVLTENLDVIMAHKVDRMIYTNREQMIPTAELQKHLLENNNKIVKKLVKLGFNTKEIKDYNLGKDVVILRKDFNRLNINK